VELPGAVETIVTEQAPVPPLVLQLEGPTKLPAPLSANSIVVPSGAFTKPPAPAFSFATAVKVWFFPTGLIAVGGPTVMFASTNVLVAVPELPCVASVVRVTSAAAGLAPGSLLSKCHTDDALAVTTPGTVLFTVNVQVAVFPTSAGALHVSVCVS